MTVADFSGYATKANLKCTDGLTIMPEAFKHMDGMQVPLIWSHGHGNVDNVLGHAVLESREDGVYAYGYFNETPQGKNAKLMVEHKDLESLSIYANKLIQKSKQVFHGMIREVSLVLAGANPGAKIDFVNIAHGDGDYETLEDEAIIYTGLILEHEDKTGNADDDDLEHATVQEVYDTLSQEQQDVVNYMIAQALESVVPEDDAEHSDDKPDEPNKDDKPGDSADEGDLNHQEGNIQMSNVFDKDKNGGAGTDTHVLSHDDMKSIVKDAFDRKTTLKDAVETYALAHGITNIETLFPEAKNLTSTPEWNKRRTEWVAGVLSSTSKTPFSRVKSIVADITMESARALGYIKGNLKKEEWFSVTKRTTTPTTIYKKQKLDRDDIIDIVDFDVVSWMKGEMRMMLEEEIARAILIGDGRPTEDPANPGEPNPDKIKDPAAATDGAGIRSILNEHELYATTVNVNIDDANSDMMEVVDKIIESRLVFRGSGSPTFYTTERMITKLLLQRNGFDQRMWKNVEELAVELRVSRIVPVEVMETMPNLVGIIVNLTDYNIGADKGGEVNLFDDFDIDYNQYKYLIETRISGALTKIKSAVIVKKTDAANVLVEDEDITVPTFVASTGVITIPTKTGVVYKNGTGTTLTAGAQTALAPGVSLLVRPTPASGYYFESSESDDGWTFTRDSA